MERVVKGVFIDRDGTLIEHVPYLSDPLKVRVKDWVKPAIKYFLDNEYYIFLHTNQSGVGRGFFSLEDVLKCNEEMILQIGLDDFFIEKCIAIEGPNDNIKYRKPSIKFEEEMIKKYRLDIGGSFFIGDSLTDYFTAKKLSCRFIAIENPVEDHSLKLLKENPSIIIHQSYKTILEELINQNDSTI